MTLAEANAILAGFDDMTSASSGRIDMDQSKRLDEDEEMPDLMDMKDWLAANNAKACEIFIVISNIFKIVW